MTQQEFYKRYSYNPNTDFLGGGGFGKVFRAWDNVEDCEVALKIQPVDPSRPMLRLTKEVEAAQKLHHPNVARYKCCYTIAETGGDTDIAVMSYYKDGSLDKLLAANTLTMEQRMDILVQLLRGIAYLHHNNIIHRDLKPQNILILRQGGGYIPKITDLGISKQVKDRVNSVVENTLMGGTQIYASPEQLQATEIRNNADLWSFGVIAFEMLTGKLPFNTGSYSPTSPNASAELYRQMKSGALPEVLNGVAEPWQTLIRRCLVYDGKERIASVEQCYAVLGLDHNGNGEVTRDSGATLIQNGNSSSNPKPKKRKWVLPVTIGCGVFFVLSIAIVLSVVLLANGCEEEPKPKPFVETLTVEELWDKANEAYGEEDYETAFGYLKRAANLGDAEAQYFAGWWYEEGKGVAQNDKESAKWYRKAADQGHMDAQLNIGYCYSQGIGVGQDYGEAVKWYRKAAEQGDDIAQYNLGVFYEEGKGVQQDSNEALSWYQAAAAQGNADAKAAVRRLKQNAVNQYWKSGNE